MFLFLNIEIQKLKFILYTNQEKNILIHNKYLLHIIYFIDVCNFQSNVKQSCFLGAILRQGF